MDVHAYVHCTCTLSGREEMHCRMYTQREVILGYCKPAYGSIYRNKSSQIARIKTHSCTTIQLYSTLVLVC